METDIQFWSYLAQFFLEWEMFQTKVVQKIKTHILCSVTFFSKNLAVYQIMWKKNIVERGRPHALHAGYLNTHTHTHTHTTYNTAFSTSIMVTRTRPQMLRYTYIACPVAYFRPTSRTRLKHWLLPTPTTGCCSVYGSVVLPPLQNVTTLICEWRNTTRFGVASHMRPCWRKNILRPFAAQREAKASAFTACMEHWNGNRQNGRLGGGGL